MKWVCYIAPLFFVVVSPFEGRAEESGPWGFQNIAVINLPSKDVKVVRSLDKRAIELQFGRWTPDIGQNIKDALSKSPLRFRLYPLRQVTMAVEIYSLTSEVDFAAKPTTSKTQIIIGEVRQEKATADLLNTDKVTVPIPEVAHMVRLGKYSAAKNALYKTRDRYSQGTQLLFRVRLALIDYLKRGRSAVRCPKLRSINVGDMEVYEAAILNAWCNKERKDADMALDYLKLLKKVKPGKSLVNRADDLERIIISGRVLTMDRVDDHLRAAAFALKHLNVIKTSLNEISFIETVADNLIRMNLANPLARMIQEMIAEDKQKRVEKLEPILVESYLAAGKTILAIDAANYFLFKTHSTWNRGRLLRGYGLALLQVGDWSNARKKLLESKALGVAWGQTESLALIEASMRSRDVSSEELNAMLDAFAETYRKVVGFERKWFDRLAAEVDLLLGKGVDKKKLASLPGYTLYEAATKANARNEQKLSSQLFGIMTKKESGWKKLAQTVREIGQMQAEAEKIEKALEVMR